MCKEIVSTSPVGLRDFAVGQEYSVFPLPNRLVNFLGNMFEEESRGASENDSLASTL